MRRRRNWLLILSLTGVLALVGAACGDDGDGDDETEATDDGGDGAEEQDRDQEGQFEDLRASDDLGVEEGDGDDDTDAPDDATDDTDGDDDTDDGPSEDAYDEYTFLEDDTGDLTLEVPEEWDDIDTSVPLRDDTGAPIGTGVVASPDSADFDAFEVPGVNFAATADTVNNDIEGLLDANSYSDVCEYQSTEDYDDEFYVGLFDVYTDCPAGAGAIVLSATAPDDDYIVIVRAVVLDDRDLVAVDEILLSSLYTGTS